MKQKLFFLFGFLSISLNFLSYSLPLHRVILASDANPMYINFWPITAKIWRDVVGLRPTLALIADDTVKIDETLGDVLRFKPIPGVPTAQHAQIIRLFLPFYFPNEGCIISDIDMIPLSKDYFIKSVEHVPNNSFVVYRDAVYGSGRFPMCYNAALGKTYAEVFGIKHSYDIPELIKKWLTYGHGWNTDELLLYQYLSTWKDYKSRCVKLGHTVEKRVDRSDWRHDIQKVKEGKYIDAHCLRPYSQYKKQIDELISSLVVYSH